MKVRFDFERLCEVLDMLLRMRREKIYPFNRTDAVVPQKLIGKDIRSDKRLLSLFYFFACIYMRGGIVSSTAFKLLLKLQRENPWMFEPAEVVKRPVEEVQALLKRYIGWDAMTAGKFWHENARILLLNWRGNPLNIIASIRKYDDAVLYYQNKNRKGDPKPKSARDHLLLDRRTLGFWGHQHKMVSMQVYFADWEGLFLKRFIYPGPVDFHNYRLFLATGAVRMTNAPEKVSFSEKISRPARAALIRYMTEKQVDPIDVADVIWLFSLLMCGESPHTQTKEQKMKPVPLFIRHDVEETWSISKLSSRKTRSLNRTCHVCAFNDSCRYAIPAGPYYGKRGDSDETGGKLVLRPRPPLAVLLKPHQIDPALINAPLEGEAAQSAHLFQEPIKAAAN
jgi:hypothetical protein